MHFTLWASRRANEGAHAEITWESFLSFVSQPQVAEQKEALEGWSPVRFAGNRRARAAVEAVSCIVLDDDSSGLPMERVCSIWAWCSGVVHSSHSHAADAPKWRIVLRCTRDMTAEEHARVWAFVRGHAAELGQTVDEATRDASRLWFVPAHKPAAPYAWQKLDGNLLDVDAILAAPQAASEERREQSPAPAPGTTLGSSLGRRAAMAAALQAAWPAKGRHAAQLALAGALRAEGFTEAEAVDFLTAVAGDRAKREATCRHTWGKPEDAPLTGWTRLKQHVDPVVVEAARAALGKDAAGAELLQRRLSEAAALSAPACAPGETVAGKLPFKTGGLDAPLPPIDYLVDGYFARGDVIMLVAHGSSLKTWLAFSMAHAVAAGRPWLAKSAVQRGRVAIIDFESGDYEVVRRLKLLGVKDAEVEDRLLRLSYPALDMTDPEAWLSIGEHKPDLLILDSFNAASPTTEENESTSALMFQLAGRFANSTNCTVVVIHHARKDSGGDPRMMVRGSTALFAACDRIFGFFDLEEKAEDVVETTVRAVKPGAGKRPVDVRVELSDQGMRAIELKDEPEDEQPTEDAYRSRIIKLLRERPQGLKRENIINELPGRKKERREVAERVLAQLENSDVINEVSLGKQKFLVLNRAVAL